MKNKILKILLFLIIILLFGYCTEANAVEIPKLEIMEYSNEYKEYLNLSDEEKSKRVEPSKYNVITPKSNSEYLKEVNNIFKRAKLVKSSLNSQYDLRDIISQNLIVKNQMDTNSCWAFATIATLETNIAVLDYKAGRAGNVYDFSERHLNYSVRSSVFNNNEKNKYGYNISFNEGGSFLMGESYLTNGMGAINEDEMKFENNENNIDISEIQNKNTTTTLYDTLIFEDVEDIGKTELMSKMKQAITEYGGIYAIFNGAQLISSTYNNVTGAIYCPDEPQYASNHSAVIIGWDDTYEVENFNEKNRPKNAGAWIIKNSWGDTQTFSLAEVREEYYSENSEELNEAGINSPEDLTEEIIMEIFDSSFGQGKTTIDGDTITSQIGDKGYMYVSYEDANIYDELYAIQKATATKDYDNIYQNDLLHPGLGVETKTTDDIYIANKFKRDSINNSETETLTMVSIFTMQEVTIKVFVNPESDDLTKMQQVELEQGETVKLGPGYHTVILKNPVKLTGESFAVAMSLQSGTDLQTFMVENKSVDENVEVNSNESFYTIGAGYEAGKWVDLCSEEAGNVNGNVSIKAFTEEEAIVPAELTEIEITTPPTKTIYVEGESFEKAGMVITAHYNDLTSKEVTDYQVLEGENLTYGKTSVTITYTEGEVTKQVQQPITVNKAHVDEEKPVASDFNEAKLTVIDAKVYLYNKLNSEDYIHISAELENIKGRDENTEYTYYYYFSTNNNEESIEEWVSLPNVIITKHENGTYTLSLEINTKDMANIDNLAEADNLYLYIKEVSTLQEESIEQLVVSLINLEETNVKYYLDNELKGSDEDIIIGDNNTDDDIVIDDNKPIITPDNDNSGDTTISPDPIPQTGVIYGGMVGIVLITGLCIYFFIKNKNIDK